MRPGKATAQDVAPLVFELARAIRARRIHPASHPVVLEAQQRCEAAWQRLSSEPCDFALGVGPIGLVLGDGAAIVERIGAYVDAGVSKFILRPAAKGDDEIMAQTRRLIEEVLPLAAARWPKPAKRRAPGRRKGAAAAKRSPRRR